jgi:zeta-carotene desaturase
MFDHAVMAVPFDALAKLLPQSPEAEPLRSQLARFETAPITAVHLWFDRPITELDHAILLDRTVQWMSNKSKILDPRSAGNGQREAGNYIEAVVSASKSLVPMSRQEVIQLAVRELGDFFPAVRRATLLKAAVVKEVHATCVPSPGSEAARPGPVTVLPRVFLAGDWTATGWPSTMEGAVRSGYRAAEAVCRSLGNGTQFLVPELPASGLMRIFE